MSYRDGRQLKFREFFKWCDVNSSYSERFECECVHLDGWLMKIERDPYEGCVTRVDVYVEPNVVKVSTHPPTISMKLYTEYENGKFYRKVMYVVSAGQYGLADWNHSIRTMFPNDSRPVAVKEFQSLMTTVNKIDIKNRINNVDEYKDLPDNIKEAFYDIDTLLEDKKITPETAEKVKDIIYCEEVSYYED